MTERSPDTVAPGSELSVIQNYVQRRWFNVWMKTVRLDSHWYTHSCPNFRSGHGVRFPQNFFPHEALWLYWYGEEKNKASPREDQSFFTNSLGSVPRKRIPLQPAKPESPKSVSGGFRIPACVHPAYSKLSEANKAQFRKLLPEVVQAHQRLFNELRSDPEQRDAEKKRWDVKFSELASDEVFPLLQRVADELMSPLLSHHNNRVRRQSLENTKLQ